MLGSFRIGRPFHLCCCHHADWHSMPSCEWSFLQLCFHMWNRTGDWDKRDLVWVGLNSPRKDNRKLYGISIYIYLLFPSKFRHQLSQQLKWSCVLRTFPLCNSMLFVTHSKGSKEILMVWVLYNFEEYRKLSRIVSCSSIFFLTLLLPSEKG